MFQKKHLITDAAWCICLFILIYFNLGLRNNTPEHNGRWISTKTSLEKTVGGAWSFFRGTQAFAHNTLHLDAWSGFQEIISKKQYSPGEIGFKLKLDKDAYIYAEFGRKSDTFSAFRISNNQIFPSAEIRAKTTGEFIFKTNIKSYDRPEKWNVVNIKINPRTKQADLYINNSKIDTYNYENREGSIGFRGGLKPSSITDVFVKDDSKNIIFRENFVFWDTALILKLILGTVILMILWSLIRLFYRSRLHLPANFLSIFQIMSLSATLLFLGLAYFYPDRYPRIDGILSFYWKAKEDDWVSREISTVDRTLSQLPPKTCFRVLFIGSSQTWGAGADTENDTFVMQSEKQLNSQLYVFAENTFQNVLGVISEDKASRKMDFINAGISGTNSTDLLKLYTNSWRNTLKPDLVVLNLSNNDMGNPKFESNLRKFVELNRPDIGTIFMLEANSIERTSGLAKNHEIVKRIGNELRIPVIDLHGYLSEKSDTGIIWWDYVHLTTHGQKLAAQLLTEYIRGNVASDSASKFEGYK